MLHTLSEQYPNPTIGVEVIVAAALQDWLIVSLHNFEKREGCNQEGVIMARRVKGPFEDKPFLVARYCEEPGRGVHFFWGEYDLGYEDASETFKTKVGWGAWLTSQSR